LGDIALKTQNLQQQPNLLNAAIQEFQRANGISPYQEFGRTNLGWLLLQYNPEEASQSFTKSVQLVPAKRGVMYGLGLSLLRQRKTDLGIEAIALEAVRDPLFITSPRWRDPQLQSLYNQLLQKTIAIYTELLNKYEQPGTLNTLLHQQRGGMFWWQGNLTAAHQDLDSYGTSFSKSILAITEGESLQSVISDFPASPTRLLLQAYSDSQQRTTLIQQAWIEEQKIELPVNLADELLNTMAQSQTFEQWVKQTSPVLSYRRQRSGFGVLSRHIDGTIPLDFYPVVDNLVMTTWLNEMLPVPVYQPELDLALQPLQENLWKQF
jgi:tetratricopeptide (TPR) repeat protein